MKTTNSHLSQIIIKKLKVKKVIAFNNYVLRPGCNMRNISRLS